MKTGNKIITINFDDYLDEGILKEDFFRKKTTRTIAGLSGRDASNDDRYLRDSVIVSVHTRNIGGESF